MDYTILPAVNASLNATSAVLILIGRRYIAQSRREAHRNCMLAAFCTSALFLVSYLTYHLNVDPVPFSGRGWVRYFYFTILVSHILLATAIVPLVIASVWTGLRDRLTRHRRLSRWTYPIWLYVSITGVLIYFMLYHWYR